MEISRASEKVDVALFEQRDWNLVQHTHTSYLASCNKLLSISQSINIQSQSCSENKHTRFCSPLLPVGLMKLSEICSSVYRADETKVLMLLLSRQGGDFCYGLKTRQKASPWKWLPAETWHDDGFLHRLTDAGWSFSITASCCMCRSAGGWMDGGFHWHHNTNTKSTTVKYGVTGNVAKISITVLMRTSFQMTTLYISQNYM